MIRRQTLAGAATVGLVIVALGCATGGQSAASSQSPSVASESAPAPAASPAPVAPAQPLINTIRWSTASEVDNFGFDVYRGDAEDGPFVRLTKTPIAGSGTSDEPHAYRFEDSTIAAGAAYFYYVESISLAGVRERFTPVIRAAPKGGPAPAAP